MLALAWAPNALAEDSLLGPSGGVIDEVAAVAPPSVSAPVDPVPIAVDVVAGVVESVEQAPPAVPKPPVAVPAVAETVAAATAAIHATSGPASSEPPSARAGVVAGLHGLRSTPSRAISVPKSSAPPIAAAQRVARPSVKPSAVPRQRVVASKGRVQAPVRAAARRAVAPHAPVPTAPQRSWTIGTPPGAAEGAWPVCAGLLLLLLLARGAGSRLVQLVPAPHPYELLLRLERPG